MSAGPFADWAETAVEALNEEVDRMDPTLHRFRRNSSGAIYDTPSCEDYCATCGAHRDDHRRRPPAPCMIPACGCDGDAHA